MSTFTPAEVAAMHPHLGCARTIRRWATNEWVDHHRTPGGHIRFNQEEVDALLIRRPKREHHPEVLAPNPDFVRRPEPPPTLRLVKGTPRSRRSA